MRKRTSFIKLIQLWGIIFLIGILVSIVAIDVIGSYRDFNLRADQMRSDYIAHQKQIVKQEVNRVVDLISYEKSQSEILTRSKIKARIYEAYSIAQNIYQQNKTAKSKSEIQQIILDALRPIRFEHGTGYYFATRLDGVEMLFADKPEMEGLDLLDVRDTRGQYVIKDMIKIVEQSGEGFYEYHWTKPDSAGNDFKKISFIKRFEPYNWFIGTGLYVDDVEGQIKANLLSTISRIRFGKEGYIFINRLNGDALVSNGKLFSGTKKLWEVFNKNPEKMKDIFDKEYNAALKPEGDYIYYSHIKLTTPDKESPKASFIYGIPDLQWLVGAGVYLDDVETDIALMQTELNNQIKAKMLYFILVVMGVVVIFFTFFSWLNRGLRNDFNLFASFFNRAAHSDEEIDRKTIKFVELDQMAEYANKMLTDRKQAQEALRESEERYRTVLETSLDPIVVYDMEGKVTYFNPAFTRVFGWTLEERLGKKMDIFMPDNAWPETQKMIEKVLSGENFSGFETRRYTKDGSIIHVNMSAAIYKDQNGNPIGSVINLRDISEQKKLEAQLQRAQKMEALGILAGGVAHDLNNVLSGIVSYPDLLLMQIPEDSPLIKPILTMQNSGKKAADIVLDLLTLARRGVVAEEVVNLNVIISEYLKNPEHEKLKSFYPKVEVETSLESDLFNISGSPVHLSKTVMNLVSNAAEAMPDGGKIFISTENRYIDRPIRSYDSIEEGDCVTLTVSDTGIGISPEDKERIFEPFYTKKVMGRSGTGLGMAVVWGTMKDHKGYIDVQSTEGKGATFTLYFPAIRLARAKEKTMLPIENYMGKGETILVVDDVKEQREIVFNLLTTLGYVVDTVSSGEKAVDYMKNNTADLLILDMIMDPGIDGLDTYRKIIEIHPGQKAIIASGFSETDRIREAQRLGAGEYIKKPYTLGKIGIAIRAELDK